MGWSSQRIVPAAAALLILFAATAVLAKESPRVRLDNLGTLVGKEYRTRGNRILHSFQGIPFAEPPSGVNRFKAPIPKAWSGELDATSPGNPCIQPEHRQVTIQVQKRSLRENEEHRNNFSRADPEDCLTLNVYTPDLTHKASLPVLVYYHGGSFMIGSEISFRPDFFLDRDVVLVVPQYRLGPFGFLSMQNEMIPGNAGLLDTLEALKWVNKHISKFGGNKNKVTVSGQSAGASIANYLMLSPLAKGLLHGVIMNSGSAIASWAQDEIPVQETRKIASFANFSGCQGADQSVSECLLKLPAEELLQAFTKYINKGLYKGGLPVKSRPDEPAETNFMPEKPADLAKKGIVNSVPLLVGATKHDSMWIIDLLHNYLKSVGLLNNEIFIREDLVDQVMNFDKMYDPVGTINDLVEQRYFSYVPPEKRGNFTEITAGLLDYVNTFTMKAPALQMAKLNSKKADSYLYTFNYIGRLHVPTNGINDPNGIFTKGVTHSDDMIYLAPRLKATFNEEEMAISRLMVDLWANFVISGNPNEPKKLSVPYWPNYNTTNKYYYEINITPRVKQNFTNEFTVAIQDSSATRLPSSITLSLLSLVVISYFK
ncbi:carboxylesterase 4A-like [Cloeon dipterum]|uniref:carboxylesterase 4A-like n=1 Tax=Cloeon dipterum TaxID=197152 RepID=UPI0032205391